jgi:hypothetical protein
MLVIYIIALQARRLKMSELTKFSLLKPTLQTPFHVDFDWWRSIDNNWRIALHDMLCPEHQAMFSDPTAEEVVDWIDPRTAEVRPIDAVQAVLIAHCARQPAFLNAQTMLVEAVFRLFLANGNAPMSAEEIGQRLGRPPEVILKTIAGPRIYKGIRPYLP